MQPLVSVIIPFYNAAPFIEQTLCSVYRQTYNSIEVICIDNNSTDSTLEKIHQLMQTHAWKLILLREPRQGAPHARNLGLKHATGSYIQFLDADDYLVEDKLEKQVHYFNTHAVDFITAEHYEIIAGTRRHKKRDFKESWQGLITGAIGITSSALFKKEILVNVAGFDPTLASNQEKDLYFRLLKNGCRHAQLPEPLFDKNFSSVSISHNTDPVKHLLTKIIFTNTVKQYLKYLDGTSDLSRLANTRCLYLYHSLCKHTSFRLWQTINTYSKRYYEFEIWKCDAAVPTKLLFTLLGPLLYFFIKKGLQHSKQKGIDILKRKRTSPILLKAKSAGTF